MFKKHIVLYYFIILVTEENFEIYLKKIKLGQTQKYIWSGLEMFCIVVITTT